MDDWTNQQVLSSAHWRCQTYNLITHFTQRFSMEFTTSRRAVYNLLLGSTFWILMDFLRLFELPSLRQQAKQHKQHKAACCRVQTFIAFVYFPIYKFLIFMHFRNNELDNDNHRLGGFSKQTTATTATRLSASKYAAIIAAAVVLLIDKKVFP